MMMHCLGRALMALCLWMACLLPVIVGGVAVAQDEQTPIETVVLDRLSVEGGKTAPVSVEEVEVAYQGRSVKAHRFTLEHRDNAFHSVRFTLPEPVDGTKFNTLTFLIKAQGDDSRQFHLGSIRLRDVKGQWNGTSVGRHIRQAEEGWYALKWDIINQPDTVRGLDPTNLRVVSMHFQFGRLPKDRPTQVLVMNMQLESGQTTLAGDPELFAKWEKFIDSYEPDYSDSAKYLQPPATGRLSQPMPLTHQGRSNASILVAADAAAPVQLAAKELQFWLERVTGAMLPVVHQAPAGDGPVIHVGQWPAGDAQAADDLAFLKGSDGYAVRARGSHIYIFGASDKGALNGVFAFLENNTDLIWPRPRRELGAVYSASPTLDIRWADARSKPVTRLRGWATNLGQRATHEIWSYRNAQNYPTGGGTDTAGASVRKAQGSYVEFGGGHNLHHFISRSSEPQRFHPVIQGQRVEKLSIWKHQLCFTHPDLPAEFTRNVLQYIAEKVPADADCVNIKIEDNKGVCECDRCLSPITLPDGRVIEPTHGAFRSTQFFMLLNHVAGEVRRSHPNLKVGTYAYFFTSTPPAIAVDESIRIYFCPYVRKDYRTPLYSPVNDHWWRQLESWARKSPNVVIREYYGIHQGLRSIAEVVAEDVRAYVERGVLEFTSELDPDESLFHHDGKVRGGGDEWDWSAMEYWVISRLYWDPSQDVESLRKHYLRRTYHEAAPEMERFFGEMRRQWLTSRSRLGGFANVWEMIRSDIVASAGREQAMRENLARAQQLVRQPLASFQVKAMSHVFERDVRMAGDKEAREAWGKHNFDVAMNFGWGPSNRWSPAQRSWSEATYQLDGTGQVVPAVRLTFNPARRSNAKPADHQVSNGIAMPLIHPGGTLELTLRAAAESGITLDQQSFKVLLMDQRNRTLPAPTQTIALQADGALRVVWALEPRLDDSGKPAPFDWDKLRSLVIRLDKLDLPDRPQAEVYLSDWKFIPASTAGDGSAEQASTKVKS